MVWNDFGSRFYIWEAENRLLSTFLVLVNPWFMPMLFVLAGMSARYALEKRTWKEFAVQRAEKLLIPFMSGIVFLVPVQTLYARKFFSGYDGGFGDHLNYFFTHITDLSGYDGAFTPGHLWFILFLMLISLAAYIPYRMLPYKRLSEKIQKMPAAAVLFLFIPVWLMYYLGNFGGFSLGKDFMLYLAGYYVLSNEAVTDRMEQNITWLLALWIPGMAVLGILYYKYAYYGDLWVSYIGWHSILVLLVFGKKYLNRHTKFTDYFNKASYPLYILHQSVLVVLAYYAVQLSDRIVWKAVVICAGSFGVTTVVYHLIRKVPVVRNMAGIRK